MNLQGEHRRAQRLRIGAIATAVALAVGAGGCGIGSKQQEADRIHASRQKVADHSPVTGTVTFELEVDREGLVALEESQRAQMAAAVSGAGGGKPALAVQIAVDGRDRRAKVVIEDPEVERATVFEDTRVVVRRQNARATERRTWARLDLARLVEDERPMDAREMSPNAVLAALASTINPVYLVELVEGALAGSVQVGGRELTNEVAVTRYDANVSFDKAMTELGFDDAEREVRMRLFHLVGHRKDVVPATFWIDAEGRLRRLTIELEQRVTRQRTNRLQITVDLTQFGAEAALDVPAEESVVTYERFGRLVRSSLPAEA